MAIKALRDDFEHALHADVGQAYSLPARFYLDAEVFEREKEAIFYRHWHYVGHLSQLENAGDYVTAQIAEEPVFVMRGEDARLRGFNSRGCGMRDSTLAAAAVTRPRAARDMVVPGRIENGGLRSCPRRRNGVALPAAERHAVDDVVAVEPAMLERRGDLARGGRQHRVGEPLVHVRGQVLERLPGLGEDLRHPDAEPLHGVAAEVGLGPAQCNHRRGKRVEHGVAEMRGSALQSPDRVRQRRRPVNQADRHAGDEQGEQRHPDPLPSGSPQSRPSGDDAHADRNRQVMVQYHQGLRIHRARRRLGRRLRPHLRRRADGPWDAPRRTARVLRTSTRAERQVLGRRPLGCRLIPPRETLRAPRRFSTFGTRSLA